MGCSSSRKISLDEKIEAHFTKTGHEVPDDAFKEIRNEFSVGENCRTALMNFKNNKYELPNKEDTEKSKRFLKALEEVYERLE